MNLTLRLPDDFAARLSSSGDLERQAFEALAAEAYRAGRLTKPELRQLLGFSTRGELDGFLKARDIYEDYSVAEIEQERKELQRLGF